MLGYYIGFCVEQKGLIFTTELHSGLITAKDHTGFIAYDPMSQQKWVDEMEAWDAPHDSPEFLRVWNR